MKIDKKNITKWVKALRSGEYKQTTGALQNSKGYCCLGVACDIFIPKNKQKRMPKSGYLYGGMPVKQPKSPSWLKYINNDFSKKTLKSLTNLNDRRKLTFNEIADLLEAVYIHEVLN